MIQINKEEAIAIRNKLKGVNVTITNRQGNSRKKSYYCEDSYPVRKLLNEMHSKQKVEHFE